MSLSPMSIGVIAITAIIVITIIIAMVTKKKKCCKSAKSQTNGQDDGGSNKQVYVGNLSYKVREEEVNDHFSKFGDITMVKIVKDRRTGRSKGFAFVTYESIKDASQSLKAHGEDFMGRSLVVRIAKPR